MGSYKAYLEQGLDLRPKIYVHDDPDLQTQRVDHPEPLDNVSQGKQSDYKTTASSSNPTPSSQDIDPALDYVAPSRIPTRPSQDTRFALTTPSSNHTHASQDIQFPPDVFLVSSSNPTRPSQDTQLVRSTPTTNSTHASQGDVNNHTSSNPRSNSLPAPSHPQHLLEPNPPPSQSLKSKDRNPSPPPAPQQPHNPCAPCAKRLWSKVTRAPPPLETPGPRTPGLWTKVLCSPTTPPPAPAPDAPEPEPSRSHRLFSRRRRSSVPQLVLSSADAQSREIKKERRQSTPMLVSARAETWPQKTRRQRSHDVLSSHHTDIDHQTTISYFLQRPGHSPFKNNQIPTHAPPSPSSPYSTSYPIKLPHRDDPSSLLPLQHHLNYTFTSPSLLSEALTPPTPGHSNNARLSYLGRRAMELVLWESCYALRLSERAAREAVTRALGVETLVGPGMRCGLGRFVSGGEGDLATEVRRGMLAVIGAVYLDGGMEEVTSVMEELGVRIGEGS